MEADKEMNFCFYFISILSKRWICGLINNHCDASLCTILHRNAFNSSPYHKILDCSKLKALADSTIYIIEKVKFVLGWLENIVGKGENDGYQKEFENFEGKGENQHFFLFIQASLVAFNFCGLFLCRPRASSE